MTEKTPLEQLALAILEAKSEREVAEAQLSSTPSWRFRQRIARERDVEFRRGQEREYLALLRSVSKRGTQVGSPGPDPALASTPASDSIG